MTEPLRKLVIVRSIVITQRSDDFHACLEGVPEIWGCGKTESAAVLDLLESHKDTFDIEITRDYLERKPAREA
jgi:hypothetical protein